MGGMMVTERKDNRSMSLYGPENGLGALHTLSPILVRDASHHGKSPQWRN